MGVDGDFDVCMGQTRVVGVAISRRGAQTRDFEQRNSGESRKVWVFEILVMRVEDLMALRGKGSFIGGTVTCSD
jgi:hypothetical protein